MIASDTFHLADMAAEADELAGREDLTPLQKAAVHYRAMDALVREAETARLVAVEQHDDALDLLRAARTALQKAAIAEADSIDATDDDAAIGEVMAERDHTAPSPSELPLPGEDAS